MLLIIGYLILANPSSPNNGSVFIDHSDCCEIVYEQLCNHLPDVKMPDMLELFDCWLDYNTGNVLG